MPAISSKTRQALVHPNKIHAAMKHNATRSRLTSDYALGDLPREDNRIPPRELMPLHQTGGKASDREEVLPRIRAGREASDLRLNRGQAQAKLVGCLTTATAVAVARSSWPMRRSGGRGRDCANGAICFEKGGGSRRAEKAEFSHWSA